MGFELDHIPDPDPTEVEWYGGARGWTDWADWTRASEWHYEAPIHESRDVRAILSVGGVICNGQGRRRRHRPTRWALKLIYGHREKEIARGRCKSIIEAQRLATPLAHQNAQAFVRWAYRECPKVSVYRYHATQVTITNLVKVEELPRDGFRYSGWHDPLTRELMKNPRNWEPWFTYFELDSDPYKVFPYGHYLFISTDSNGTIGATIQDRRSWSWSGCGDAAITKLAADLPSWHEPAH